MPRLKSFLAKFIGTERVGDLTLNQVGLLLYLHFNRREERFSSPEKLGNELDMAEQTVVTGFSTLKRYFGFSDLAMASLIVFGLGALFGTSYLVQQLYPSSLWIWLAVTMPFVIGMVYMIIRLLRIARDSHRRQLFLALKKRE